MPNPLVSICVPTYNRAALLQESLKNIQTQTYSPLEILISDNGSTDETQAVCHRTAEKDPRIRYYRQPRNIGLYPNHNFCIDRSKGEFLCFFHDHDLHQPRMVQEYASFLIQHPEVGVVCSDWDMIDEQGRSLGTREYSVKPVLPGLEYIDRTIRSGRSFVAAPGAMLRRSALGSIRFDEGGPLGFGDFLVWFQMAERFHVGHIAQRLWGMRQQRGAQSDRTIESMAQDFHENLNRYCDGYLTRWPQQARRVARWRDQIRKYLFWALAYEVGLHFRNGESRVKGAHVPTVFEILDYRLSPEAFQRVLEKLRVYRTGSMQQIAFFVIHALLRLKATTPLTWATTNPSLFRKWLKLN